MKIIFKKLKKISIVIIIVRIGIYMGVMINGTNMYDHFLMMTTLYTKGNSAQLLETISYAIQWSPISLIQLQSRWCSPSDLINVDDNRRYSIS